MYEGVEDWSHINLRAVALNKQGFLDQQFSPVIALCQNNFDIEIYAVFFIFGQMLCVVSLLIGHAAWVVSC